MRRSVALACVVAFALPTAGCRRGADERAKRVLEEEDGDVVDPPEPDPDPPSPFLPPCLRPLSGTITTSTTIDMPVCVVGTLTIKHGATLTFTAGARVEFGKGGAIVVRNGALVAHGTEEDPIVFTSSADPPAAGDWFGLVFANKTRARSILDHADVGFAGGDGPTQKAVGALVVVGSSGVDLGPMKIHDSGSKGLVMIAAMGSGGGSITL